MTPLQPPSAARQLRLLVGLAAARFRNRVLAPFQRKKKPAPGAPARGRTSRAPTPKKRAAGTLILLLLTPLWLFMSYGMAARLVDGAVGMDLDRLTVPTRAIRSLVESRADFLAPGEPPEWLEWGEKQKIVSRLSMRLRHEPGFGGGDEAAREAFAKEILEHFLKHDLAGFRSRDLFLTAIVRDALAPWPDGAAAARTRSALSFLVLLLFLTVVFSSLGSGNVDLGKTEWSLEWLWGQPASAATLFTAKLLEYTILQPLGWILGAPLFAAIFLQRGLGWESIPLACAMTLALCAAAGAVRLLVETWSRTRATRAHNLQAASTLIGTSGFVALIWIANAEVWPAWVENAAPWSLWRRLPFGLLLTPAVNGASFGTAAISALAPAAALGLGAVAWSSRLVRDGLRTAGGTFRGGRGPAGAAAARATATAPARSRGTVLAAAAKDLRLLLRDRNFFVQVLIVPVVVIGMQLVFNRPLLDAVTQEFRNAATLAFAAGAYMLLFSAAGVLALEGQALWLLYSFPKPVERVLLGKSMVWAAVATLYTAAILAGFAWYGAAPGLGEIGIIALVLAGVALHALIAAALGSLACDPLEPEKNRRVKPATLYLFMLMASTYGTALYAPSWWAKVVQVTLSSLFALALWQKLRDRLPYLLDPTEAPPPRLSLADGIAATIAFFAVQVFAMLFLAQSDLPFGAQAFVAYSIAGAVVAGCSWIIFGRRRYERASPRAGAAASGAGGVVVGLLASAVALAYLAGLDRIESLRAWKESQLELSSGVGAESAWPFILLAVVAAPLFEEYLFRGILFRGMRRSLAARYAIPFSAALFTIVHPAISAPGVFALGLATAYVYERTGRLAAPIVAHALYNGIVVAWQLLQSNVS